MIRTKKESKITGMIKDFLAITILTWLIELVGKALYGALSLTARAIGATIGGLGGLLFKNLLEKPTEAIVTKAIDGDSLLVKTEDGAKEVRIKGIDAPEYGQDGFLTAKRKVQSLTLGQKIRLLESEMDNYGRIAAKVELEHNNKDVAQELSKEGVVYPDPRGSTKEIKKLANEAKKKSLGVWQKDQKTPWEFRDMM